MYGIHSLLLVCMIVTMYPVIFIIFSVHRECASTGLGVVEVGR
jgi:hypothetical protein